MFTTTSHLQRIKCFSGENSSFCLLFKVTSLILTRQHLKAVIESLYSVVNENKPESSDRNSLEIEGFLSFILCNYQIQQ